MNPALWAAKTGLDAQQTRMTVVSNNLANVNTTGFKKGRAVFEDLLYQNVRQVGGATSQDTERPTGLYLGTGVRVVATEKTYHPGQPQSDRQLARRGDQRPRLLPGAAARRHAGLHPRRLLPDRAPRASWSPSSGYEVQPAHHHSRRARRASPSAPTAWSACSWPARSTPTQVGTLQLADFVNPAGPAAARREPAGRDRRQRHRADRHAGPERPRHAAAGLARRLERQRGRGAGEHDRDAARLRNELQGDLDHRPDAPVPQQQPVIRRAP